MIRISSLIQAYLEQEFHLGWKTKDGRERSFRYLIYAVGDKLVTKLSRDDLENFKGWLIKDQKLAKSSANSHIRDIVRVLNWAVEVKRVIAESPAVGFKQFRTTPSPIRTYEDAQFGELLKAASPIWQARLWAGRFGLRRGEALNLTKANIRDGYMFVEPKKPGRDGATWLWEPKTHECRAVPLPEPLTDLLDVLPCCYPMLSMRLYGRLMKLNKRGLLSEKKRGCPDQNFNRDFRLLQQRAFGKVIGSFHDLRRTFITASLELGIPLHVVQAMSGHKKIETLMTYYTRVRWSAVESAKELLHNSVKTGLPEFARTI
jgi:integrase